MLSMIVLAAGKSVRMHGKNKLLAKVDGTEMIRRVVQAALESKVDEVIVVLGGEADKVQKVLTDLPCRLVVNKKYEDGQSSSVKVGLGEVSPMTRAVLVLPGDVAMIDFRSINVVIEEYEREKRSIVIAAHKGQAGHPILFDKHLFSEIEQIDEQTFGLKAVVKRHEGEVCLVDTGSSNALKDVDTPEDLKEL
ncbi:MAG: nucleotidyltransferase family protein [Candidatus Bathyarchaeia archaeon]|jgi:molybdenum cofactor cytidylyltransferase